VKAMISDKMMSVQIEGKSILHYCLSTRKRNVANLLVQPLKETKIDKSTFFTTKDSHSEICKQIQKLEYLYQDKPRSLQYIGTLLIQNCLQFNPGASLDKTFYGPDGKPKKIPLYFSACTNRDRPDRIGTHSAF
jgi:hypothetical protein